MLQYKPDFDRAKTYWQAFWAHTIIDRPCVLVTAPADHPPTPKQAWPAYMGALDDDREKTFAEIEYSMAATYFGGEAMPCYVPSFGPDQFAAFLGAALHVMPEVGTSWVEPFVTDWADYTPTLSPDHAYWQKMQSFTADLARFSEGRFLIGTLDLHSNMDALSAIRGPELLCMDLLDCPEAIDRVMTQMRRLYGPIFDTLFRLGDMAKRGSLGWLPAYGEGKSAVVQCDFLYMIGPEHARRFVMPALAEEAAFLDHTVLHLDGPGALRHLDDILAIKDIDAIQWVPGAGQPPTYQWMELLQTMQKAGKGLWLYDWPFDVVKARYKELRPEGLAFQMHAESPQEAEAILQWFKANT